jgi:hypothetical protein
MNRRCFISCLHQLYVVSEILDARYNEQEMFYELLVAWRGFPVREAT